MKRSLRIGTVCLLTILATSCQQKQIAIEEGEETLRFTLGGKLVWQLNHSEAEGKPYFHPLATTEGKVLTDLRPEDHPWHRALWFSWKTINGVNYWEESRETGLSDGFTKIVRVDRSVEPDKTVTVNMNLAYTPAKGNGDAVMTEEREVTIGPPDADGVYRMDWSSVFTALEEDVVLDRTPLEGEEGGKSWGGYAGYSIRMAKTVIGGTFLNSEGAGGAEANRQPARWMSYTAPDGGGILILDHPSNIRHPVKWYLVEAMPYFSPAIIHDGPYTIGAGKSLSLRYRSIVYPGTLDSKTADKEWTSWVE